MAWIRGHKTSNDKDEHAQASPSLQKALYQPNTTASE